jgi:hypothetical protein
VIGQKLSMTYITAWSGSSLGTLHLVQSLVTFSMYEYAVVGQNLPLAQSLVSFFFCIRCDWPEVPRTFLWCTCTHWSVSSSDTLRLSRIEIVHSHWSEPSPGTTHLHLNSTVFLIGREMKSALCYWSGPERSNPRGV